jgi:hypothetical protein
MAAVSAAADSQGKKESGSEETFIRRTSLEFDKEHDAKIAETVRRKLRKSVFFIVLK